MLVTTVQAGVQMRFTLITGCIVSAITGFSSVASAGIIINTSLPGTNVLESQTGGTTNTRLIDEDTNANHARGSGFTLTPGTGTGYSIQAISIQSNSIQSWAGAELSLFLYQGTTAQFDTGTGHSTVPDGSDYYVGTTVTPLASETLALNASAVSGDWITFEFSTPQAVANGGDFGFFFVYEEGTSGNNDIVHREAGSGTYGRTSITTTDHATGTRALNFVVQGVSVPEPSSIALIGLLGLGFAARRRRV